MPLDYEALRARMLEIRKKNKYVRRPKDPNSPKRYKGPNITKENLLKALHGTAGVFRMIADRLKVGTDAVKMVLKRPGWEDMFAAWQEESERVVDESEITVREMVKQRKNLPTALAAAKLVLDSKGRVRGWGQEVKVVTSPIQVDHNLVNLETLSLPLDVRRQILRAFDESVRPQEEKRVVAIRKRV